MKASMGFLLALLCAAGSFAQVPDTVFLDELTWMEVRDKIAAGTTTAIVATAGTEQNGDTALHIAAENGHRNIVKHLLR